MKTSKLPALVAILIGGVGLLVAWFLIEGLPTASHGSQLATLSSDTKASIEAALLTIDDFPAGWREGQVQAADGRNYVGRIVTFRGARDPRETWINTSQEIYAYPDADAATQDYARWLAEYSPTDVWQYAAQINFANRADQVQTGCLLTSINGDQSWDAALSLAIET